MMAENSKISIANLSWLSDTSSFLLQTSKKSKALNDYIKENLPKDQRKWLSDLSSWEISIKSILDVSDICLKEYDQVFFDYGDELFDLNDAKNYQRFREKVIEGFI
jgi:hypothetical protein